ncbi:MAG: YCF48-related protein [Bacteroidota bacterium]
MRRLLVLIWLLPAGLHAGEWFWQYPHPQGNALWSVRFCDEWHGYAVGDWGTIMFSNDRGLTWDLQYEAVTDNLRDLAVVSPLTACAVGDNGFILRTTDGGVQWVGQPSGTLSGLNGVFFLDALTGWACGDHRTVRKTTDGGLSWLGQTLPGMGGGTSANDVVFLSAQAGWVVGGTTGGVGYIWNTTDGGATWLLRYTAGSILQTVGFLSPSIGLAGGAGGALFRTTNGGAAWLSVASGTSLGLNDIYAGGLSDCWISGDNGTILRSTTSGATWQLTTLPTYANVHSLSSAGQVMVAAGEGGMLAHAVLPGEWAMDNPGMHKSANWVTFADPYHGVVVGQDGIILRTYDGGVHWDTVSSGVTGDSFYGAAMAGPDRVWAVGDGGALIHSSNGGVTWVGQGSGTVNSLLSISFVSPLLGWAAGDLGTLLKTTNGGAQWLPMGTGTSEVLFGVTFKDAQNGWMTGNNGLIMRSTNGGATWSPQSSGTGAALFSATFLDLSLGYCAGGNGTILKTTDGGASWMSLPTGTLRNIYVAAPTSQMGGRAVGDTGLVLVTTNGGASWTPEFAKTEYDVFGLHALEDTTAWICGDSSVVLRTGGTSYASVTVAVDEGWNMVAMPVSRSAGLDSVGQLYPAALNGQAFGFDPGTGYASTLTMQAGRGYWCKFPGPETVEIAGTPLMTGIAEVGEGWNMAGGLSVPVDTGMITSVPPGLRASEWFSYDGTYTSVGILQPGAAYWVKSSGPGLFLLSGGVPAELSLDRLRTLAPPVGGTPARDGGDGLLSPKFREVKRPRPR